MENPALPSTEAFVDLTLLNGGSMVGSKHLLHAGDSPADFRLYNWAFLIQHPSSNRRVLWDVGMTSKEDDYPPVITKKFIGPHHVAGPVESLAEQIKRRREIDAEEIDTVVMSHAHFDHCRPVKREFKNAKVLFGPGTAEHCSPGHLEDPTSMWDGRIFDPRQGTENWDTLTGPWVKFGAFDEAMDFFGDQSFWIMKSPGHMPGNLSACVRLNGGEWSHSELLDGTKEPATLSLPDGTTFSLHADLPTAKETISRIQTMERDLKVHISLAHDADWMLEEKDEVLLQLLDEPFKSDMRRALPHHLPF
ncbi:hypothetical protein N7478_001305 [Penicillium angulare]|uniref:uncharacterized protein n=1 Tax=Penicillium angulare TaxID=116970 RepID=UPI002541D52F|nr:uncharacterized protein N7478_001305 [Penicillium angulare]KAJ5292054.1 hypothetical protein N7478_001305 [Penicillium angulare]